MPANVFVLGLDLLNLESLLGMSDEYRFNRLLSIEELQEGHDIPFAELLGKATAELEHFDGRIDAIVGYWDFPISSMVPILAERFGVPGAPLRSVVTCEHKYWSRLEQQEAIEEYPRFAYLDPDDPASVDLEPPYWIKPVKAFSSELAFRIDDQDELPACLEEIRAQIGRVAEGFDYVMSLIDLPPEIEQVGARACLAEEAAVGDQVTVEGFRAKPGTDPVVYAVVDSLPHPDVPSFERYQYPSAVPEAVQQRMADVASRVIKQIGLAWSTFNVEFFWDRASDRLTVLEVNPRHSQSHAKLLEYVEGVPNHRYMVDLGLGRTPTVSSTGGRYRVAAKWFLRHLQDGQVTRAPTEYERGEAERAVPGVSIDVIVGEGDRLSELHDQDSYSYKLAQICIGADDESELRAKYERCRELLPFEIRP